MRDSWYEDYGDDGGYRQYVSVAERRANAAAAAKSLEKERGRPLSPIKIEGRTIAKSFWGKAWCENLEAYSDYANRLPRGRTYARNGSVIDLEIAKGRVTALVSGSDIYELEIKVDTLPPPAWLAIQRDCSSSIASLLDLLQGRFDRGVMERLTQKKDGLFPKPKEIRMDCSCPDGAGMCKHIAAVMYGIGARLDHSPELLFVLRNVDHFELISHAVSAENLDRELAGDTSSTLQSDALGDLFGIELETSPPASVNESSPPSATSRSRKPTKTPPAARPKSAKQKPAARKRNASTNAVTAKPPAPAKPAKNAAVLSGGQSASTPDTKSPTTGRAENRKKSTKRSTRSGKKPGKPPAAVTRPSRKQ